MIDLYTWTTPNGRKISVMLEESGPRQSARMALLPDCEYRPDARAGEPFHQRGAGKIALRDRSLCHRMRAPVEGHGRSACAHRIHRARLLDCGYRALSVGGRWI